MARRTLRNWAEAADTFAETLRRASLRWPGDAGLRETIDILHTIPEFAARWRPQGPGHPVTSTLRFDHPQLGAVDAPFETLESGQEQSVVVWLVARVPVADRTLRLVPPQAAGQ